MRIDEFEVDLLRRRRAAAVQRRTLRRRAGRRCSRSTWAVRTREEAASRLIAEARKAGGPDNITAVVIRLETPEPDGGPGGDDEVTLSVPAEADEVTLVSPRPLRRAPAPRTPEALEAGADEAVTEPGRTRRRAATRSSSRPRPCRRRRDPARCRAPAEPPASGEPSPAPLQDDTAAGEAAAETARRSRGRARLRARPGATGAGVRTAGQVAPPPRVALVHAVSRACSCWPARSGAVTLSTVYYVGIDDGRLAVYSGLPAAAGPLPLHAVYRRSSVEYSSLTPVQRQVVDEQALRGKSAALALAAALGMQL